MCMSLLLNYASDISDTTDTIDTTATMATTTTLILLAHRTRSGDPFTDVIGLRDSSLALRMTT